MTKELKPCPCREAFEKWCEYQQFSFYKNPLKRMAKSFSGRYESENVERSWKAWQAAWNTRHGEK